MGHGAHDRDDEFDHGGWRPGNRPWRDPDGPRDRVTHLVFVDGRLADQWTEPVEGTRWEPIAWEWDGERRPAPPPPRPAPAWHLQVSEWLEDVCGGRAAVLALTEDPLEDDGSDLPDTGDRRTQERLAEVWSLLERASALHLDAEAGVALRRALVQVWQRDPWAVTSPSSPAHLAGGVLWAVGKANLLLYPCTPLTQRELGGQLGLRVPLSTSGHLVRHALGARGAGVPEPWGAPRLLSLGRCDLLVSDVRRRLVRLRDRALAEADEGAA